MVAVFVDAVLAVHAACGGGAQIEVVASVALLVMFVDHVKLVVLSRVILGVHMVPAVHREN